MDPEEGIVVDYACKEFIVHNYVTRDISESLETTALVRSDAAVGIPLKEGK